MEPKFQSSFIPKGPIATATPGVPVMRKSRSLLGFVAGTVFGISVVLAVGVFGYKLYLGYRIDKMGAELEAARAQIAPDTIKEITRLNDRIIASGNLLDSHKVVSPLLDFIEVSTLKAVRFLDFTFEESPKGDMVLKMRGQARGYSALALQADIFNKSSYFKNTVFSDLNLNEVGDVSFVVESLINQDLVSYKKEIERMGKPVATPSLGSGAPTTTNPSLVASTTKSTATSSKATTTTSTSTKR